MNRTDDGCHTRKPPCWCHGPRKAEPWWQTGHAESYLSDEHIFELDGLTTSWFNSHLLSSLWTVFFKKMHAILSDSESTYHRFFLSEHPTTNDWKTLTSLWFSFVFWCTVQWNPSNDYCIDLGDWIGSSQILRRQEFWILMHFQLPLGVRQIRWTWEP